MCVVCGVTGVGVLFILARSIAQGLTEPELVTNTENPEGKTVSMKHLHFQHVSLIISGTLYISLAVSFAYNMLFGTASTY